MTWIARWAPAGLALLLVACTGEPPLRIGVLASLSGRSVATGHDGRNGAMLAVEQHNAAAGGHGRRLELVVQDNGADAASSRQAMQALLDAGVDAVVGPFSSFVAAAALPLAQAARIPLLSPNVTATSLAGQDDQLLLMSPNARAASAAYAERLWQRGHRRLALATSVEPRNAIYYTGWRDGFRAAFRRLGGEVLPGGDFRSDADPAFGELARELTAGAPDGVLLVCQVVDAARLARQLRRLAPQLPLAAADGAATQALIALGGQAVEGMLVGQPRDMDSAAPAHTAFVQAFRARFGQEPGYPALMAYEAVTLVAVAQQRRRARESLKDALLGHGPYPGLQQPIGFDANGDAREGLRFAVVREGRFQLLQ